MVTLLELAFESRQLRDLCTKAAIAQRELGKALSEKLQARLADMRSAQAATELVVGRPTEIESGRMALELTEGRQIVFRTNHQEVPRYKDGRVNWSKVTRIKIEGIEKTNGDR